VRNGVDLTAYGGIGEAISSAIQEIVKTGTLGKLEKLRSAASPKLASLSNIHALIRSAFCVFTRSSVSLPSRHFGKSWKAANLRAFLEFALHNTYAKV
jgi:hypothetical protein